MGWFWETNTSSSDPSSEDPLRDLDPTLRDFLEKESPVKYKPVAAPPPSTSPTSATSATDANTSRDTNTTEPSVPRESLYQDGRYAHLWKTYRPLDVVEAEGKSDQERLSDVLEGYKDRKAQIGRTAVENCVFEQEAIDQCYERGKFTDRLTMCRTETRAFERCYTMQARFLKALGYMSTYDRPASVDEDIQMHADRLYHRMLDQERAIEEAKAKGEEAPTFLPILEPNNQKSQSFRKATFNSVVGQQTPAEANLAAVAAARKEKDERDLPPLSPEIEQKLKPAAARQLRERMKDMTPFEREIEVMATVVEIEDASRTGRQIENIRDEVRKRRKELGEGRGEIGDFIVKWFGWPGQK